MPDAQTSVQADRRETVQPEYRSAAEPTEEQEEEEEETLFGIV